MKRLTNLILFLNVFVICKGQIISFSKKSYKPGETITATVIGNLTGIENGVSNTSYSATEGTLTLGTPLKGGFYRIDFKFASNITKSYLIGVSAEAEQTLEEYNIALTDGKISSIPSELAEKMLLYFKNETSSAALLAVSKEGLSKFCKENAVALVSNASFCITMVSGVPLVVTICQSLTASNAKKLGVEVLKAFVVDMKKKNYLTDAQYTKIILAIDATQVGKILQSNCSLVFKSLKTLSNDDNLKLALGYFEQQCKTTVLIIEKFKVVP